MSENCTHDCSTCSQSCSSREDEKPQESLLERPHMFSRIKRVVAVVSGKGGVGKSMVTSMLAVLLRRRGLNVGILDADVTGPSIPKAFGLKQKAEGSEDGIYPVQSKTGVRVMSLNLLLEHDTDPVVWRGPVIAGAVKQFWTDVIWGELDVLLIDMPPGTGDVPLTVFQSIPVDGVMMVTTPQELVGMIVGKAARMAEIMNIPVLGLVENMSFVRCPDCGKLIRPFGESRLDEIAGKYHIPLCASMPIDPSLTLACDKGLIELFEGDYLDAAADRIEDMPVTERA